VFADNGIVGVDIDCGCSCYNKDQPKKEQNITEKPASEKGKSPKRN
jgi:hypothetical protein